MKTAGVFVIGVLVGMLALAIFFLYPMVSKSLDCQDCDEKLGRCQNDLKEAAVEKQNMVGADARANAILNRRAEAEANMMMETVTLSNGSYVPINITGVPAENAQAILRALEVFAESHPELQILCWHLEKRDGIPGVVSPRIYGIWIQHLSQETPDFPFVPFTP